MSNAKNIYRRRRVCREFESEWCIEKVALGERITSYRGLSCILHRNLQRHRAVFPRQHGFLV